LSADFWRCSMLCIWFLLIAGCGKESTCQFATKHISERRVD
jgi:hypothetical protein